MSENNLPSVELGGLPTKEMQTKLRRVDRREWWLWSSVVAVIVLLMLGMSSFGFTGLLSQMDSYSGLMSRAVKGLGAVVIIFLGHAVYQQIQISRIRRQLIEQVCAVDKVEVLAKEVYNLAILDSLTGSYNRRFAEHRLAAEISRSSRHGAPLTVILFDLNDFKKANDKYGHAAGDAMLKAFAERLGKSTRGSDVAARYGGDEFAAILPECKTEDVQYVLKRLDGLQVEFAGVTLPVSYSAGWANYIAGESSEDLLRRVDMDLYANKRSAKALAPLAVS